MLAAISIGIALALPAGGHLLLASLQQLGQGSSANPQISVFMALDADAKASEKLGEQLKANPEITEAQFIGRETTQKRLREAGLAQVIDSLPQNPFPDTFVVTPGYQPEALESLRAELAKLPRVDQVQVDSAWAKRLSVLLNLGRTVVWLLAAVFGTGLVALIFNTIRLQVLTKREEIEVSRLLGATDTYIGRPYLLFRRPARRARWLVRLRRGIRQLLHPSGTRGRAGRALPYGFRTPPVTAHGRPAAARDLRGARLAGSSAVGAPAFARFLIVRPG